MNEWMDRTEVEGAVSCMITCNRLLCHPLLRSLSLSSPLSQMKYDYSFVDVKFVHCNQGLQDVVIRSRIRRSRKEEEEWVSREYFSMKK